MWEKRNDRLVRIFKFSDFSSAFSFMTQVALLAEKMNHHPKWTNEYNLVEIQLSTHEHGNQITDKDWQLAEAIDQLFL